MKKWIINEEINEEWSDESRLMRRWMKKKNMNQELKYERRMQLVNLLTTPPLFIKLVPPPLT